MTRALRRDEDDIDAFRRNDGFEVNGKSVREEKRFAGTQIRFDVALINCCLLGVWQCDENDVSAADSFSRAHHFEASFFGDWDGFAAFIKSDDDFEAAVFE